MKHADRVRAGELLEEVAAVSAPHLTEESRQEMLSELRDDAQVEMLDTIERVTLDDFKRTEANMRVPGA